MFDEPEKYIMSLNKKKRTLNTFPCDEEPFKII